VTIIVVVVEGEVWVVVVLVNKILSIYNYILQQEIQHTRSVSLQLLVLVSLAVVLLVVVMLLVA
jgi:hypothetical protein